MFVFKRDTVYLTVILLVLFGAMLSGMEASGLTTIFFIGAALAWLHKNHIENKEFKEQKNDEEAKKYLYEATKKLVKKHEDL